MVEWSSFPRSGWSLLAYKTKADSNPHSGWRKRHTGNLFDCCPEQSNLSAPTWQVFKLHMTEACQCLHGSSALLLTAGLLLLDLVLYQLMRLCTWRDTGLQQHKIKICWGSIVSSEEAHPTIASSPILDVHGLIRVGSQEDLSKPPYSHRHPIILPGKHTVTKLLIRGEHLRHLHAGPTLVAASLSHKHHIIGSRRVITSITRACVPCRWISSKLHKGSAMIGQLSVDWHTPGMTTTLDPWW